MVSVEFTRFHNYYNKAKDLNAHAGHHDQGRGQLPSSGAVRYFINVGEKDGYDWMRLKDFIRDTAGLGRDDIFKVDVKDSFGFFNSEPEVSEQILATFKDLKIDGRFINVEVSKNPGGSGGGKRRSRSGSGRDRGKKKANSRADDRGGNKRRERSKQKATNSGKRRSNKRKGNFF